MTARRLSALDKLLGQIQRQLPGAPVAAASDSSSLSPRERQHAAGLMRVNHAGEVAAQALYRGQASVARRMAVREQLEQAAREESAHLEWCATRLNELGSRPSALSPLWYGASYGIGRLAGLAGDRWSLGFVAETERQVEQHLEGHLKRLPAGDAKSREIIERMKADEARHGHEARAAGAADLPPPVRGLMRAVARLMTGTAYYF